jgi:hypothetical protein
LFSVASNAESGAALPTQRAPFFATSASRFSVADQRSAVTSRFAERERERRSSPTARSVADSSIRIDRKPISRASC